MNEEILKLIVGAMSATSGAALMKLWSDYQNKTTVKGKTVVLKEMYEQLEELYKKNTDLLLAFQEVSEKNAELIKELELLKRKLNKNG